MDLNNCYLSLWPNLNKFYPKLIKHLFLNFLFVFDTIWEPKGYLQISAHLAELIQGYSERMRLKRRPNTLKI